MHAKKRFETVFLQLKVEVRPADDGAAWTVHLWSQHSGTSPPVVSLQAMSFASFVGLA